MRFIKYPGQAYGIHIGVLFRQRLKISLLQVDAFLQIFMQNLQFESLVPVWQSVKQQEQRQRCVW